MRISKNDKSGVIRKSLSYKIKAIWKGVSLLLQLLDDSVVKINSRLHFLQKF